MKTYTQLKNFYTNLSQNKSAENVSLGGELINISHRYLLQKYFDNEKTFATTTVGTQKLTLTVAPSAGDTSATLTVPWAFGSVSQTVNFSNSDMREILFSPNSANISWSAGLKSSATTSITTNGGQFYTIPPNVSKITDATITIGQLKFVPAPISTRAEWDLINFIPYEADIPNYYFIYDNQVGIWPIPSTTGNLLTFNYKSRVRDMTYEDYSTGNITTMTKGSTSVVGTATSWLVGGKYPANTDISDQYLALKVDTPYGDGMWYRIERFIDDTHLILRQGVLDAPDITTASTYTIGQIPLLQEDFHDMLVYKSLMTYFSTIVKDGEAFKQNEMLFIEKKAELDNYAGTKSVNVDLGGQPTFINPNLFPYKGN